MRERETERRQSTSVHLAIIVIRRGKRGGGGGGGAEKAAADCDSECQWPPQVARQRGESGKWEMKQKAIDDEREERAKERERGGRKDG